MNWHAGNIAEAVAESKAKDAIFVVYIEGQDEMSTKLSRFLGDERVHSKLSTTDFVAVKIQGDSPTYSQFIALYKVVPVPSIFFIGKSGTPLEIATGIVACVDELVAKIDKVLLLAGKRSEDSEASTSVEHREELATTTRSIGGAGAEDSDQEQEQQIPKPEKKQEEQQQPAAETAPEQELGPIEIEPEHVEPISPAVSGAAAERRSATSTILQNATATLLPAAVNLVQNPTPVSLTQEPQSEVQQMQEVQRLIEQRKKEREEEEQRREQENELRRRREAREAQTQQALAREQELKNLQDRIKRERQQEQEERERIRAQIAADRAEHANRISLSSEIQSINTLGSTSTAGGAAALADTDSTSSSADETRLQIRLPGGLNRTKAFAASAALSSVRVYVRQELLAGSNIREFTLATSYPRREFSTEDEEKSLNELQLVPNAVILVLKREQINRVVRTGGNLMTMLTSMFWALLTPVAVAFDYLNKMGLQRLRERFTQMVNNVSWNRNGGRANGGGDTVLVQTDASARRNMDMFVLRPAPAPGLPQQQQAPDASPTAESSTPVDQSAQGQNETSSQSQRGTSRSARFRFGESNIRRLADTQPDKKDDKATYNGNSTQQQ
ncbi:CG8042 [Drosophila busckii]|uniref:UBX domain-containing protein 4 n=1 Tax=Drosophila busckii TaxID=30019 RepID=A0A0M5J3J7_DROBS|nr:UBX domain-containing protein 4 [Drosophila busckii]ALC43398.1 CG8042 [Drosophila busckii]